MRVETIRMTAAKWSKSNSFENRSRYYYRTVCCYRWNCTYARSVRFYFFCVEQFPFCFTSSWYSNSSIRFAPFINSLLNSPSEKWKWDSPLIARFGRVTGKVAVLSLLDPIALYLGYKWREIHYVIFEDIQVFIEKRRNVLNFHLLDESLDIPDPVLVVAGLNLNNQSTSEKSGKENANYSGDKVSASKGLENIAKSTFDDEQQIVATDSVQVSFDNAGVDSAIPGDSAEKKANEMSSISI